jgi:GT2 family glycosyltransferase
MLIQMMGPVLKTLDSQEETERHPAAPLIKAGVGPGQANITDLRARLSDYETQLRLLAELLSDAQARLRCKTDLLIWIINSRSWQLTSHLRRLKTFNERRKTGSLWGGGDCFHGQLEQPAADSRHSGYVDISGWVYSETGPIKHVEAFLDDIPIGNLIYGEARADIAEYPSKAPLQCGFHGSLFVDDSFAGQRRLSLLVTDKRGRTKHFIVQVIVEKTTLSVAANTRARGSGFAIADESANPFLRDDLSTAKRLLASISKISLQNFLISGARIVFPRAERPEVSIVLVLYNRAELTLQCLYSILGNAFSSYEVIIIDNASSDETRELLKRVEGATIILNEDNLHYLLACNQGSRLAKGEFILLLNNDTQFEPQSLSAALRTIRSSSDIGAVGGKIILQDGSLQEAGSIIWRDGSCEGYGRGDSPFAPAYMFKRDVDYCSAAFLLTRRDLFLRDGGFDEAYGPAYYEETDYCVRLWRQGKRIVYDPDVTLFHYEFASSGSSESAIKLQAQHRSIFAERHKAWLSSHLDPSPDNLLSSRSRLKSGAKRILFLDDRVPHLTLGSGFPRSNRIICELVAGGHEITCYPLDFTNEPWTSVYQDIPREVEVMAGQGVANLESFLEERGDHFDVIIVSRPHNMATLRSVINRIPDRKSRVVIYDAEALFSLREIQQLRLKGKRLSAKERQSMIDEELKLAEGCDRVVSVSEAEGAEFRKYGFKSVHTLGHALTIAPTPASFSDRRDFLFVGAMHFADSPNADSMLWFCNKILPLIRRKLGGQSRLIIAGWLNEDVEEQLSKLDVHLAGEVEDLTALYNNCRVFVAPTRYAAGVPHKVHEASAHGLPSVVTPLLASQLGWGHGHELLVGDDAEAFAAACVRLYKEPELWDAIRANALLKVESDCSPEAFAEQLRTIVD